MRTSEKFWNILAPIYANLRQNPVSGYFLKKENQAFKTLMEELVPSEIRTICDLGVGRGHSLKLIPETIQEKIAIDKSMTMIHYTKKDFPENNFIQADVLNLPLKGESIQLIICIGLIEYIPDLEILFKQLDFILMNEGHIILSYSPKSVFTYLRFLRGHRIYTRNSGEIEIFFRKFGFKISGLQETPMQNQYLLKKM